MWYNVEYLYVQTIQRSLHIVCIKKKKGRNFDVTFTASSRNTITPANPFVLSPFENLDVSISAAASSWLSSIAHERIVMSFG